MGHGWSQNCGSLNFREYLLKEVFLFSNTPQITFKKLLYMPIKSYYSYLRLDPSLPNFAVKINEI